MTVEMRVPDSYSSGHVPHLELVATCGETRREGTHTVGAKHDHTPEQFQKDIADRVQLLAEEAAGHEQARVLQEEFFK